LRPQGNGSTAGGQYLNGVRFVVNRIAGVPIDGSLASLRGEIIACRRCPRLVEWRERVAREKRAAFANWDYWGHPVPGFGDPRARILVVGLAPAAHGGNRTGRIFTGDRSGDFLFEIVYRCGLSNQPTSVSADDGLVVKDLYVAAVVRCCPPGNRPTPEERDNCLPFLTREIRLLERLRVIVALGSFAWDGALRALHQTGYPTPRPRPRFGHGAEVRVGPYTLVGSFHPSQQNTFTGKLTSDMLEAVLRRGIELAG
jgi:uracil-DNA glycosylase